MTLVGYSDKLCVRPGDAIAFMVSTDAAAYEADVIRLIHGDLNPAGPGLRYETVASAVAGRYTGRLQPLHRGSHIIVSEMPALELWGGFTLALWLYPTVMTGGEQAVFSHALSTGDGPTLEVLLSHEMHVEFRLRDDAGGEARVRSAGALPVGRWAFVACSFDPAAARASVHTAVGAGRRPAGPLRTVDARAEVRCRAARSGPILFAARWAGPAWGPPAAHLNGKLEAPELRAGALDAVAVARILAGRDLAPSGDVLGAWNLAAVGDSEIVADRSGRGRHGRVVNAPTRAATGHLWDGTCLNFAAAPEQYAAIHFHDDDLSDAGWRPDVEWAVPADLPSGVYALRLRADGADEHLPFVVRAAPGRERDVLLVLPTFSYLAYANEHMVLDPRRRPRVTLEAAVRHATPYEARQFTYLVEQRLLSLYDLHSDGSGVCYASRLRPLLNVRPGYNKPGLDFRAPHQFNADLYLVDWLEAMGFAYDVATDDDLHRDGAALLRPYRTVMTGTHPEYVTQQMLAALEDYLQDGGRLMYMGGNGVYWVTSVDPARPHLIELRRGESGTRAWQAAPGEYYHSTTGEPGGLWRFRGRPPQALVGVGFTAQGTDRASPYRRALSEADPEVGFVFEGVADELLGDFGLHLGGAAGWELDRADPALGTPAGTRVLATSVGHSDSYQHAVEEAMRMSAQEGGTQQPLVRADMVYVPYPNGGAVFSTGSISYAGSLSHHGYDNNISRITANVLRRFCGDARPAGEGEAPR